MLVAEKKLSEMCDDEIYNDVFYSQDDYDRIPPSKPPRTFQYELDHFKHRPPVKPPRSQCKTQDSIPEEVSKI